MRCVSAVATNLFRSDIWFALGLTDAGSTAKSEDDVQSDGAAAAAEERAGDAHDDQNGTEVITKTMGSQSEAPTKYALLYLTPVHRSRL